MAKKSKLQSSGKIGSVKSTAPRRKKASTAGRQVTLSWAPSAYNPQGLSAYTEKQLRREYRRLRDAARKRILRLEKSEFYDSDVLKYNSLEKYKRLSDIKSKNELKRLLSDVSRFVTAKTGSVSGLKERRKQQLRTLHEHGYTFVNKGNLREWGEFMQYLKARYPYHPSETASVLEPAYKEFKALRARDLTAAQVQTRFESWMKEQFPTATYFREVTTPVPEEFRHANS